MTDFRVLGHRGAILPDGPFYQNSMAAFAEALECADGFETDACASRDGDVFLIHEAKYVQAQTGVEYCLEEHLTAATAPLAADRRLEDMSSAEIRALRLKDGTPIPELKAVLQQVARQPGKILNIELKAHKVLPPVLAALKDCPLPASQLVLSSFNHPSLLDARAAAPHIPLGAIFVAADTAAAPLFPWHAGSVGQYCPLNEATLSQPVLQQVQPDYVVLPDLELNGKSLELIARLLPRARVFAWVFTERGGADPQQLLRTVQELAPTGRLAGLMVDNPRTYAPLLRHASGFSLK